MTSRLEALMSIARGDAVDLPPPPPFTERRVDPSGPLDALIAVIGEAPGHEEVEAGKPFVGKSGKKLRAWARNAGIDLNTCYVDNAFPYYPPGGNIKNILADLLAQHTQQLWARLNRLTNVRVVVPTGNVSLKAVLNLDSITKHRGSIYPVYVGQRQVKAVPIIHPAAVLRGQAIWERRGYLDWLRIAEEAKTEELTLPQRRHIIEPTPAEIFDFLERARSASCVAIDIETKPSEGRILCVGFSIIPCEGLVLVWAPQYIEIIKQLCALPVTKALWNHLYDLWWLRREGVQVNGRVRDGMHALHALMPTDNVGLAYATSTMTREQFYKEESKDQDDRTAEENWNAFLAYNSKDACVTRELDYPIFGRLEAEGMTDFYIKHYEELAEPMLDLMLQGVRIDHERRKVVLDELLTEARQTRDALAAYNDGQPLFTLSTKRDKAVWAALCEDGLENADGLPYTHEQIQKSLDTIAAKTVSREKLKNLVYNKFGLPIQFKKRDNGEETETLDIFTLQQFRLAKDTPDAVRPVLDLAIEHTKKQKLATFITDNKFDEDGRMRFSLKVTTEQGRLASSASPRGRKVNSQNIPRNKRVRTLILPEEGHVVLQNDGCLVGDTLVETPYGAVPIANLHVGDLVFSERERRVVVGEVTAKRLVGDRPVMRLILDNGESIIGTLDHKFPVVRCYGGGRGAGKGARIWAIEDIELQDLRFEDRLLPLRKSLDKHGYEVVYSRSAFEYAYTHQLVAKVVYGQQPPNCDTHHLDGDRLNNHPSNLGYKERSAHLREHIEARWATAEEEIRQTWIARLVAQNKSRSYDHHGEKNPRYGHRQGYIFNCLTCGKEAYSEQGRQQKYCSHTCYVTSPVCGKYERQLAGDYFSCLACGSEFYRSPCYTKPPREKRYCSRDCARRRHQLNHRVVAVEPLLCLQPVYTITVEPDHNYALSAGVFTKNSAAEARVCFVRTKDSELIAMARDRFHDQHRQTGVIVGFAPTYDETPENMAQVQGEKRQISKSISHGAQRRLQGARLSQTLMKEWNEEEWGPFTFDEAYCDTIIERYHKRFPAIRRWHEEVRKQIWKDRLLVNSWGRRWPVPYYNLDDELWRRGVSFLLQSEVADWLNIWGFKSVWTWLRDNKMQSRVMLQEHDGLVLSCAPDEAYDVAVFLRDSLEQEREYDGVALSIPVETAVGPNWGTKTQEWKILPGRDVFEAAIKEILKETV